MGETRAQFNPVKVVRVEKLELTGLYCPLVGSGSFLADGILVSCYASVDSQTLAHLSMAPLRLWHQLRTKRIAIKSHDPNDGIHSYAMVLIKIRRSLNICLEKLRQL